MPAAILKIFETHLSHQMAAHRGRGGGPDEITYDLVQLFNYVDGLADLCALVFDQSSLTYVPRGKEWIKKRLQVRLEQIARSGGQ